MPDLDTHDIDSLAGAMYFIVGRGTEGGASPYHLSIAGITFRSEEPSWGKLEKVVGNSGYSLGTIQVDLGQRGTWPLGATKNRPLEPGETTYVDGLIAQAAQYAEEHHMKFASDREKLRSDLLSHGNGEGHRGTLVFIDTDTRDAIDAWASSDSGRRWIHQNIDFPQIRNATQSALDMLEADGRNITESHRLEAVALLTKTANQMPSKMTELRQVLRDDGDYEDLIAKANEIGRFSRQYDGPKAAGLAGLYVSAHEDKETAAALDRAQAKVGAVDFDPSTAAVDPDFREALKASGQAPPVRLLRQGSHGDQVIALQADLVKLGITDAHGRALHPDGAFGPGTRGAVVKFQRAHGLEADGLVGPKTLERLHDATRLQSATLAARSHPGNPLFCQALEGVRLIDAKCGRTPDYLSQNFAGSLATAAHAQGLGRIDHVVLGENATRAFAVQGDLGSPLKQMAGVDILQAIAKPLEQSSAEFHAFAQLGLPQQADEARVPQTFVEPAHSGIQR